MSAMVELKTFNEAIAWGEGWEAYAIELRKRLERSEMDRQFWMEQSDFWSQQLESVVKMWIKADQPPQPSDLPPVEESEEEYNPFP